MPRQRRSTPRSGSNRTRGGRATAITAVLQYLVDTYGKDLGLPAWGSRDFGRRFSKRADDLGIKMAAGFIDGIFRGKTLAINDRSAGKLATLFAPCIPNITGDVFAARTLAEFKRQINAKGQGGMVISLRAPAIPADVARSGCKPDEGGGAFC